MPRSIHAGHHVTRVALNTSQLKRRQARQIALCLALGALSVVYMQVLVRDGDEPQLAGVIAAFWGLFFLVCAAGMVWRWRSWNGSRDAVVSGGGITFEVGTATPFGAEWSEVADVRLTVATKPMSRSTGPLRRVVRLVIRVADPDLFQAQHPDMHRNPLLVDLEADEYGVALLQQIELVDPLDRALQATAGDRYLGVVHSTVKHLMLQ